MRKIAISDAASGDRKSDHSYTRQGTRERRKTIRLHAQRVHHSIQAALAEQKDRDDLGERFREVVQKLPGIR